MSPRVRVEPRLYKSPISLPAGKCGRFEVKRKVERRGKAMDIVSMREMVTVGLRPTIVRLPEDTTIHVLSEDGVGVWMTDCPQELRQAADWLLQHKPRGRVLIGGLGLGVVASWVAALSKVDHVEVVEIEQDVIELVAKHQGGYTVRCDDIFAFVRNVPEWRWEYAFLDTWQGTNEATWWSTVMPLRRLIANRFGRQKVTCWAEDQMIGQVRQALLVGNASTMKRLGFEGGGRCWFYEGFPAEMSEAAARHFTTQVGLPDWERRWGKIVDAGIAKHTEVSK